MQCNCLKYNYLIFRTPLVLFDNETGISHTAARLTNNAPEKQCLFLHLRRLIPAKSREYTCFISEISYQNV